MEFLVTEVTQMSGGRSCVAGLDLESRRWVRPLQGSGYHWTTENCHENGFWVGNVLRLAPREQTSNRELPHANEDLLIEDDFKVLGAQSAAETLEAVSQIASPDIAAAFGGYLVQNKWVMPGSNCHSLGAITIAASSIELFENYNKLTCTVRDSSGTAITKKITCWMWNELFRAGGENAVRQKLRESESEMRAVLLGLAHPFVAENTTEERCWLQVNGILGPSW